MIRKTLTFLEAEVDRFVGDVLECLTVVFVQMSAEALLDNVFLQFAVFKQTILLEDALREAVVSLELLLLLLVLNAIQMLLAVRIVLHVVISTREWAALFEFLGLVHALLMLLVVLSVLSMLSLLARLAAQSGLKNDTNSFFCLRSVNLLTHSNQNGQDK